MDKETPKQAQTGVSKPVGNPAETRQIQNGENDRTEKTVERSGVINDPDNHSLAAEKDPNGP